MAASPPHRLYRSRSERMISGVSGGLALYFATDPALIRVLWVLGAIFTGGLVLVGYLVMWIVVPEEGFSGSSSQIMRHNVGQMSEEARRAADEVRGAVRPEPAAQPANAPAVDPTAVEPTIVDPAGVDPTTVDSAAVDPATVDLTAVEPTVVEPDQPEPIGGEIIQAYEVTEEHQQRRRNMWAAVILIALGVLFLASNFGLFRWFNWGLYWPLILVAVGIVILLTRVRR